MFYNIEIAAKLSLAQEGRFLRDKPNPEVIRKNSNMNSIRKNNRPISLH